MKEIISNKYILMLSRIILGFIFVFAGAEKIADPAGFAGSIDNYKLFPLFLVNISAITIPWIEVTAGLLLILGVTVKENAVIISSLLLIFIFLIAISLLRGLNIDCGCYGTSSPHAAGINKIIENLIMLLLGIQLIFFGSDFLKLTGSPK